MGLCEASTVGVAVGTVVDGADVKVGANEWLTEGVTEGDEVGVKERWMVGDADA